MTNILLPIQDGCVPRAVITPEIERHIRLLSECAKERDQLKARVAELEAEAARQVGAIAQLQRFKWNDQQMRSMEAENDRLAAELAALKGRKVKLDDGFNIAVAGGNHRVVLRETAKANVIDAGVEVVE